LQFTDDDDDDDDDRCLQNQTNPQYPLDKKYGLGTTNFLPVSIWNVFHLRFKAVSVVSLVTTITQQQFVLIVSAVAELAVLHCNKYTITILCLTNYTRRDGY